MSIQNKSTTKQVGKESQEVIEDQGSSRNLVIVWVATAIAIAFGLFLYIFTHGTYVPYLGPVVGN